MTFFKYLNRTIFFLHENAKENDACLKYATKPKNHLLVELELELVVLAVLEEPGGDLLGDDLGADVVLGGQAQPHLLQDQLNLNTR